MTFSHEVSGNSRNERLSLQEAIERYCREKYPHQTAGAMVATWGVSLHQAREALRGRASRDLIEQVMLSRNGGWPVMIEVLGLVMGPFEDFAASERNRAFLTIETLADLSFASELRRPA